MQKPNTWILVLGISIAISVSILLLAQAMPTDKVSHAALPDPKQIIADSGQGEQTITFAGGCFWGVEAVFRHTKGVLSAISGYAGGKKVNPRYEQVSSGKTGHAESVQVVYDPEKIAFEQLLKIYFAVAHDPTQLNYQGPDHGTQYRSAIFTTNGEQASVARAYISQLQAARIFNKPIVTEVTPLPVFYPAEDYHQNYLARHTNQPYIVKNDLPKLAQLRAQFPALYR